MKSFPSSSLLLVAVEPIVNRILLFACGDAPLLREWLTSATPPTWAAISQPPAICSAFDEAPYHLVGLLLYGCGLRLAECVNLRVQCFNLYSMLLTIHDGKGQKDRTVPLPARALPEIRDQMDLVRRLQAQDLAAGYAGTFLPRQLEKKYKNAAKEFIWQWFFPAPTLTFVPALREQRR